jgi:hypothetical protein
MDRTERLMRSGNVRAAGAFEIGIYTKISGIGVVVSVRY